MTMKLWDNGSVCVLCWLWLDNFSVLFWRNNLGLMVYVKRHVGASCLLEGSLDTVLASLIPSLKPEEFWEPVITGEHMTCHFWSWVWAPSAQIALGHGVFYLKPSGLPKTWQRWGGGGMQKPFWGVTPLSHLSYFSFLSPHSAWYCNHSILSSCWASKCFSITLGGFVQDKVLLLTGLCVVMRYHLPEISVLAVLAPLLYLRLFALTSLSHSQLSSSLFLLHPWMFKCPLLWASSAPYNPSPPKSPGVRHPGSPSVIRRGGKWPFRRVLFSLQLWPVLSATHKGIGCLSLRSQQAAVLSHPAPAVRTVASCPSLH